MSAVVAAVVDCVEVCAGAGGMSLGLTRAGMRVLAVEKDAAACATHRANTGPCVEADITDWHPPVRAAVTAGGPPCQPFTQQGKKLGLDDPRGMLFEQMVRIAGESGSDTFVMENVPGILRKHGAKRAPMELVLEAWAKAGFHAVWRILDAADYGVPQHRKRVIIVGFRDPDWAREFQWPEPTHGPDRPLPYRSMRDALGLVGDFAKGGLHRPSVGAKGMRRIDVDAPSWTIGTGNNSDWLVPADDPAGARRLRLDECSVLQGFDPGFQWTGTPSEQHTQMGNSLPPALGEAIGRAIMEVRTRMTEARPAAAAEAEEASSAPEPETGTLWKCGTTAGACVVRVEGVQRNLLDGHATVAIVVARRGRAPLRFDESVRSVPALGFARRYTPIDEATALSLVRSSRAKPRPAKNKQEVRVDDRQVEMGAVQSVGALNGTVGGSPTGWAFDAVVLNAGIGGASAGVAQAGFRVVGLEPDPDMARAHRENVGECVIAEPLGWKVPAGARARLVFYALPPAFPKDPLPARSLLPEAEGRDDSDAEREERAAAWPRRRRFEDALRVASDCGATAVIIEVAGGRRGKDTDVEEIRVYAERAGFRVSHAKLDPVNLGLPQSRPTRLVVALKVGRASAPVRWPKVTHAVKGNMFSLHQLVTVRDALRLTGDFMHSGPDSVVRTGVPRLNVDAPAPPVGPKGLAEKILRMPSPGQAEDAPRQVGIEDLRALQGLPPSFVFGGECPREAPAKKVWERDCFQAVATAFPPVLARAVAEAAKRCLDDAEADVGAESGADVEEGASA